MEKLNVVKASFLKIVIILYVLFLFGGCEEALPPPSKKGKNTFGCKVDGKNYEPTHGGLFAPDPFEFSFEDKVLQIYASDVKARDHSSIYLQIENVTGKGKYPLNFDIDPWSHAKRSNHLSYTFEHDFFYTNSDLKGHVEITKLDRAKKIISGRFECQLRQFQKPDNKVEITKGRFDLNYK